MTSEDRNYVVMELVDRHGRFVRRNLPGHGQEMLMTLRAARALIKREQVHHRGWPEGAFTWKIYRLEEVS